MAVGGVGGSGTRLVARILLELGFYLGSELNNSLDNLCFTRLFKRPEALDCSESEFQSLWRTFKEAMSAPGARWGWKEPNTHVVLPRLRAILPELRYVHVMRNGLDMAYSSNQNQLGMWGARFLKLDAVTITPRLSLKYWVAVHRRVLVTASEMGSHFLLCNYDDLCANPAPELSKLMLFLGFEPSPSRLTRAVRLIQPPSSIGRFKEHSLDQFDRDDIAFVASLGFDTSPTPI